MENNNLKENIRKNVKEKIAVSNIRREFDMKNNKNKKLIYWVTSSAAVFILGVGIIVGTNTFNLTNTQNPSYGIADLNNNKTSNDEKLNVDLQINKLNGVGMAKFDVDTKTILSESLPNEVKFMENVSILKDFKKQETYAIYTRSNPETKEYDLLHDYVFTYKKDDKHEIRIALSTVGEPVRDYFLDGNKVSKIGDVELEISQYENSYMATFKLQNVYLDIETVGITENELIEVLQSIINQN